MYELGQYNSTDATEMSVPVCALWLVDTILGIWSSCSHKMLVSNCAIYKLTGLLLSVCILFIYMYLPHWACCSIEGGVASF